MTTTAYFTHPAALIDHGATIGPRSRIWAFAHILPGAVIGSDCNICDHVFIENDVILGDRVTIKCGVQLWDGVRLGNDVFVGPNVTFTNDPFPRSRHRPTTFSQTMISDGASIGANATILPGLTIGTGAMVGAGSVVTTSIPANAIAMGNPARITGYVDANSIPPEAKVEQPAAISCTTSSKVRGVTLHRLPRFVDMRGELTVGNFSTDVPFIPHRYFVVFGVPSRAVRGQHAHHQCHQYLVCTQGTVRVLVDDGGRREEFVLNSPELGLYIPPLTWSEQFAFSADASLLVFASHSYSTADYIREYKAFTETVRIP